MDLRKIKKLIELVEESGIEELEVTAGDESVRIVLPRRGVPLATMPVQASTATTANLRNIVAPMAGTFYRAPSPDAEPFVGVGDEVEPGTVVCIIESMKMMHEIKANVAGRIHAICHENGTAIGTGEALFKLS